MILKLGILNWKLLILLGYPICYQIRRAIFNEQSKPLYEIFTNFIGYLLALIFYLIERHRAKHENQFINTKELKIKKKENTNSFSEIESDLQNSKKKKKILNI